jgi:hypothetical protein
MAITEAPTSDTHHCTRVSMSLEAALRCGHALEDFLVVEWELAT